MPMGQDEKEKRTAQTLEENLKKALTEMLVLSLLAREESYIGALTAEIERRSGGTLSIVFPYGVIYRMTRAEYITESKKRNAPDGRLRQYYRITDGGRAYLSELLATYRQFTAGVEQVLREEDDRHA